MAARGVASRRSIRRSIYIGLTLTLAVAAGLNASAFGTVIRVHAILTEPGLVTREAVELMLAEANQVYSAVGLSFELVALEVDLDPTLKKDQGPSVLSGGEPLFASDIELHRETRAAQCEGEIVVFFRPFLEDLEIWEAIGPSRPASEFKAANYSSGWSACVIMAGADGQHFAHEVGHYFHLAHTHSWATDELYSIGVTQGYEALKARAVAMIRDAGGLSVFDGDGLQDTPPDPGPPIFQPSSYDFDESTSNPTEHCFGTMSLNVDGAIYVLSPDRGNLMSYYTGCVPQQAFSPAQRGVVGQSLSSLNRRGLADDVFPEGPAAVVLPDGAIHIFARGDDQRIWHNVWDGILWSGWQADLSEKVLTSGPAAIVSDDGAIHVFARGEDRSIWHAYLKDRAWSSWQADLGPGTLTSGPAAVTSEGGFIHVFARGDDRNVWHSYWDGQAWNGWRADVGVGTVTSSLAAVASADGAIHVFARREDRSIWHTFWKGGAWSGWRADLGAATLTSGPAALAYGGGDIHLFARGDDLALWHNFWNGSTWSGWIADPPRRVFFSTATAIATGDGALHLFVEGDNRSIWHSFWKGGAWNPWQDEPALGTFQP